MIPGAKYDDPQVLGRGPKLIAQIITILSLAFSLFILVVIITKVQKTLTNNIIMQIIIAEIFDGFTILLSLLQDKFHTESFGSYNKVMYVCYTQIYLGLFVLLWVLSSSFIISLRIYDLLIGQNKIFKNQNINRKSPVYTFLFPALLAMIFWLIQLKFQVNSNNNAYKEGYLYFLPLSKKELVEKNIVHFRHMYCWVDPTLNYILLGIVTVIIVLNLYFSIYKGLFYVSQFTQEIIEANNQKRKKLVDNNYSDCEGGKTVYYYTEATDDTSFVKKLEKMKAIKCSLIAFPISSSILTILFFGIQIVFDNIHNSASMSNGVVAWIYCVLIGSRQLIYTIIFFAYQPKIKEYIQEFLVCYNKKRNMFLNDVNVEDINTRVNSEDKIAI